MVFDDRKTRPIWQVVLRALIAPQDRQSLDANIDARNAFVEVRECQVEVSFTRVAIKVLHMTRRRKYVS